MLKKAVHSTLEDDSFSIDASLAKTSRQCASRLLVWLERTDKSKLELLLTPILQELEMAFQTSARTLQTRREKMWGQYHTIRTSDRFVRLWVLLFKEADTQALQTLYQHLTHLMFKEMIQIHFPIAESQPSSSCDVSTTTDYEEANAVRFVAGYVCRAVRKKVQASSSPLRQELLLAIWELLEDEDPVISSESENEDQQLASSDWVNAVNRGGLLRVTDNTYLVFARMEAVVQTHFAICKLKSITDGQKDDLLTEVVSDDEVQFHWSLVSADMCERVSRELLKRIANMWITIRGHSFSKSYVEIYKQQQKKMTSRSKGLRKELFTSKIQ